MSDVGGRPAILVFLGTQVRGFSGWDSCYGGFAYKFKAVADLGWGVCWWKVLEGAEKIGLVDGYKVLVSDEVGFD